MPSINLRPWREELRAGKQRQFLTSIVIVLVIAVALVFLWQDFVSSQIEYQNSRNSYLQTSMSELDKKIKEIKRLESDKKELLDRMKVIQDLQGTRSVIVRVLDELVRTLPDGLYYESLSMTGEEISIYGMAESNNRISGLMRNFESSVWFSNPNLKDVSAVEVQGDKENLLNKFDLTVRKVTPDVDSDEETKSNNEGAK